MNNMLNILLGAVIASIVPLATLYFNNQKWKKEKLVEHLRIKHDRLEKIYGEILFELSDSIRDNLYSEETIAKIRIYSSAKASKIFFDMIASKDNKAEYENNKRICAALFSIAAKEHLLEIEYKIEKILTTS
ncbi:MAG: hypothetical protein V2B20_13810 [Pseudomonadota bacterium]